MNEFKDRVASNLNRRKYVIEDNTIERNECGEIVSFIAEEIRADSPYENAEGTALNSENLNNIVKGMINDVVSLLPLTDETIVKIDKMYLKIPTKVIESFNLPLVGEYGSVIEWYSSDPDIIQINNSVAEVTRDIITRSCTLTATIRNGGFEQTKNFTVTVSYREMTDIEIAEYDANHTLIKDFVTSSFQLPTRGLKGSTITWIAGVTTGVTLTTDNRIEFTRPTGNTGIILSGTFKYGNASYNKRFEVVIVGTDCYTPKSLSTTITQIDGNLQSHNLKLSTSNLEGLYVEIENNAEPYITFQKENNGTNEVTLVVRETADSNSLTGSGTYTFNYKVHVYLNSDHTLLLGTINGVVTYHATSSTPED